MPKLQPCLGSSCAAVVPFTNPDLQNHCRRAHSYLFMYFLKRGKQPRRVSQMQAGMPAPYSSISVTGAGQFRVSAGEGQEQVSERRRGEHLIDTLPESVPCAAARSPSC